MIATGDEGPAASVRPPLNAMPRVLLLIPTASYRAADYLDAAARLGIEIVVGSDEDQPLADLVPGRALTAHFHQPEEGARRIARFADASPLDAIIAVDDAGALLAARAAALLALPHSPLAAVEATRNKALLRQRLAAAGLPSPWFQTWPVDADPTVAAERTRYPCVIKPLSLAGGRGVIRADDRPAFGAAVQRLRAILQRPDVAAECGATAGEYLVEGYIPGDEVALEGLLQDGVLHPLALFTKPDPLEGPFFAETIYVTPSRLPPARQRQITASAEAAARALGIVHGPLHAEFRLNQDGIWPIDIAARTIGGLCSRVLRFQGGVSLEEIVLRRATGAPIASFERETPAAGVMMIPLRVPGTLGAVHGLEEARAVPGIRAVTMSAHPGQELVPLPEGGAYLGFIFADGETPEAVEAALREAHLRLHFDVRTGGAVPADPSPDAGAREPPL